VTRLFVYGSLQPGGPNEHVLTAFEGEWKPAVMKGTLVNSGWGASIGYPGLVVDEKGGDVRGHIFISSHLDAHWAYLDEFEGEEYERIVATAILANGEQVQAHVYVLRGR